MRRIISVLLAITMLFSCGMVAMAEDAAATPAVGIEEMAFLAKLGVMDADASPEATITRAEMAKIVMMCLGQNANVSPMDTPFTDVNSSNEYSGYIQLANSANIMVGSGDGTFDPNGNVTYNQVVKLLTHAIGHEIFAYSAGGYPGGYLITGMDNGMLDGTTPAGEQAVSHGVAAVLIKNALEIELYNKIAYGDSYKYESQEGVTALSKYFNIYKYTGIVTANHYASLAGTSSLKEDEILFDDVAVLKVGDTNAAEYLGYMMDLYVHIETNVRNKTIIAAYPDTDATTVIPGGDVMDKTTESVLYYETADGEEEIDIDANADMIYNGSQKYWSDMDLKYNFGNVTTIDNDNDGDADVLIVYNYENVIVNSTKASDNKVFLKDTFGGENFVVIDPESKTVKTTFVNTSGEAVTFDDIEEWNIISIALSEDGTVMKAILSDKVVTGQIAAFDEETLTVGETDYKYDATAVEAPSVADFGKDASFYLDFAGRVAVIDFDGAIAGMNYGYVRGSLASGTGFNRKAEIEMLVDEGITVFELAKEVKFNGEKVDKETVINSDLMKANGVAIKQLIMYSLDEEGKIDKINTAIDDTANELDKDVKDDTFTIDASLTGNDAYYYNQTNLRYFNMQYLVRENTKVFVVQNPSEAVDDEDLYKVWTPASITADVWARAIMYDVDSDRIASAVVLYYLPGMFSKSTGDHIAAIVTGITRALNEEGDPVKRFELYNQTGTTMTLDLEDDQKTVTHVGSNTTDPALLNEGGTFKALTLADIKVGDVIQYSTNKINKKIEQIRFVARLGALEEKETNLAHSKGQVTALNYHSGYFVTYGIVDAVLKGGVAYKTYNTVLTPKTATDRTVTIASNTKILHYDTVSKKLEPISKDELVAGEDIFIYRQSANTYFIVSID